MGKERMIERICCNRVRMASGEESEPHTIVGGGFGMSWVSHEGWRAWSFWMILGSVGEKRPSDCNSEMALEKAP